MRKEEEKSGPLCYN